MIRRPHIAGISLPQTQSENNGVEPTDFGIFCDCHGTLLLDSGPNTLLVQYLNAQHAIGERVIIFSSMPSQVREQIETIGLHPALVNTLRSKSRYYGRVLDVWIDDQPSSSSLIARTIHHPQDQAFIRSMRVFIEAQKASPPSPSAP